jgi:hypothetical protein
LGPVVPSFKVGGMLLERWQPVFRAALRPDDLQGTFPQPWHLAQRQNSPFESSLKHGCSDKRQGVPFCARRHSGAADHNKSTALSSVRSPRPVMIASGRSGMSRFVLAAHVLNQHSFPGRRIVSSADRNSVRWLHDHSDVLPRPGGAENKTWSRGSPRWRAAAIDIPRTFLRRAWPTNSASECGRNE